MFNKLKQDKYFINYDNDTKLDKLVELFADINALHPFREGNGRSQRLFIESLAKINRIYLDLTNVYSHFQFHFQFHFHYFDPFLFLILH